MRNDQSTFIKELGYLIDEFDELQDLRWSDLQYLDEYRELKMKKNDGLPINQVRLDQLELIYKNKIVTSARWNKFQNALVGMQKFIKTEVEGFVIEKQLEITDYVDLKKSEVGTVVEDGKIAINTTKDNALISIENKKDNIMDYMDATTAGAIRNDIGIMGSSTIEGRSLVDKINILKAQSDSMELAKADKTALALTDAEVLANKENLGTHVADEATHGIGDKATLKTTHKASIVGAMNELFTNVSNGKSAIATAITGKGVVTSGSDTFAKMANNISSIKVGDYSKGDYILPTKIERGATLSQPISGRRQSITHNFVYSRVNNMHTDGEFAYLFQAEYDIGRHGKYKLPDFSLVKNSFNYYFHSGMYGGQNSVLRTENKFLFIVNQGTKKVALVDNDFNEIWSIGTGSSNIRGAFATDSFLYMINESVNTISRLNLKNQAISSLNISALSALVIYAIFTTNDNELFIGFRQSGRQYIAKITIGGEIIWKQQIGTYNGDISIIGTINEDRIVVHFNTSQTFSKLLVISSKNQYEPIVETSMGGVLHFKSLVNEYGIYINVSNSINYRVYTVDDLTLLYSDTSMSHSPMLLSDGGIFSNTFSDSEIRSARHVVKIN